MPTEYYDSSSDRLQLGNEWLTEGKALQKPLPASDPKISATMNCLEHAAAQQYRVAGRLSRPMPLRVTSTFW